CSRFNPYDRAPFRVLREGDESETYARDALAYYKAYVTFSQICHSPQNATTIALRPGTVIFLDNFRIFHSRTSFKGQDFHAKARTHGYGGEFDDSFEKATWSRQIVFIHLHKFKKNRKSQWKHWNNTMYNMYFIEGHRKGSLRSASSEN
ncbi:hypothetical protein OSTOST_04446, partial [Ostertagia ostertagi]